MEFTLPYRNTLDKYTIAGQRVPTIQIFCKSLYVFLAVKIIFLWTLIHDIVIYAPVEWISSWQRVIYAPATLASKYPDIFLIVLMFVLLTGLLTKTNLFLSLLIAWLSICLSRLTGSIANGSDAVLNLYLFLSLGFSIRPVSLLRILHWDTTVFSSFTLLLCRLQLALIYAMSGIDKLLSEAWRSGDAIHSIMNLEYFWNPVLPDSLTPPIYWMAAWSVILFEIGFAALIWIQRFRMPLIFLGVCFHIGIIFFLGLPDFGIIMIITYLLFLKK